MSDMKAHHVYDDEEKSRVIASVHPASDHSVQTVLAADVDDDGRSPWMWVRLQNGDLILGIYPQGDTYLQLERDAQYPEPPKAVLKPSTVLRRVKAGTLSDTQPGLVFCYAGHSTGGQTQSPSFWENGSYVGCNTCKAWVLARPKFADFEIDVSGERKKYDNVSRPLD